MSDTSTTQTDMTKIKYARALSELSPTKNNFLDQNSIVELSHETKDENNNNIYKSYQTTLKTVSDELIEQFALYNNLNAIFNSNVHLNDTYFGGNENDTGHKTIFDNNPYIANVEDLDYGRITRKIIHPKQIYKRIKYNSEDNGGEATWYTIKADEISGSTYHAATEMGWEDKIIPMGVYAFEEQVPNTIPIYLYWRATSERRYSPYSDFKDHRRYNLPNKETDPLEAWPWEFRGIVFYVFDPTKLSQINSNRYTNFYLSCGLNPGLRGETTADKYWSDSLYYTYPINAVTDVPENTFVSYSIEQGGNKLVTKSDIQDYFATKGSCVPVFTPQSTYRYYVNDEERWAYDSDANPRQPMVLSNTLDGIWTSDSQVKFNFGNTLYTYTNEITTPKNVMLNATGNIVLDVNYSEKWYTNQHYFVAVTINGKVITLVFLKNILHIADNNGNKYVIGQFHLNCPLAAGTKFRIITNAKCNLYGVTDERVFTRKLYDSLNAVNLNFYEP